MLTNRRDAEPQRLRRENIRIRTLPTGSRHFDAIALSCRMLSSCWCSESKARVMKLPRR
jgi:hypothetical protein